MHMSALPILSWEWLAGLPPPLQQMTSEGEYCAAQRPPANEIGSPWTSWTPHITISKNATTVHLKGDNAWTTWSYMYNIALYIRKMILSKIKAGPDTNGKARKNGHKNLTYFICWMSGLKVICAVCVISLHRRYIMTRQRMADIPRRSHSNQMSSCKIPFSV